MRLELIPGAKLLTKKKEIMKTNNYFIDGESGSYRTLNEIRLHIWMQSESDKQAYNGMQIFRENDDKFFRTIDIRKNGKIVFIK